MLHLLIRLDRKHGQKARTDEVRRAEKSWHLERVNPVGGNSLDGFSVPVRV